MEALSCLQPGPAHCATRGTVRNGGAAYDACQLPLVPTAHLYATKSGMRRRHHHPHSRPPGLRLTAKCSSSSPCNRNRSSSPLGDGPLSSRPPASLTPRPDNPSTFQQLPHAAVADAAVGAPTFAVPPTTLANPVIDGLAVDDDDIDLLCLPEIVIDSLDEEDAFSNVLLPSSFDSPPSTLHTHTDPPLNFPAGGQQTSNGDNSGVLAKVDTGVNSSSHNREVYHALRHGAARALDRAEEEYRRAFRELQEAQSRLASTRMLAAELDLLSLPPPNVEAPHAGMDSPSLASGLGRSEQLGLSWQPKQGSWYAASGRLADAGQRFGASDGILDPFGAIDWLPADDGFREPQYAEAGGVADAELLAPEERGGAGAGAPWVGDVRSLSPRESWERLRDAEDLRAQSRAALDRAAQQLLRRLKEEEELQARVMDHHIDMLDRGGQYHVASWLVDEVEGSWKDDDADGAFEGADEADGYGGGDGTRSNGVEGGSVGGSSSVNVLPPVPLAVTLDLDRAVRGYDEEAVRFLQDLPYDRVLRIRPIVSGAPMEPTTLADERWERGTAAFDPHTYGVPSDALIDAATESLEASVKAFRQDEPSDPSGQSDASGFQLGSAAGLLGLPGPDGTSERSAAPGAVTGQGACAGFLPSAGPWPVPRLPAVATHLTSSTVGQREQASAQSLSGVDGSKASGVCVYGAAVQREGRGTVERGVVSGSGVRPALPIDGDSFALPYVEGDLDEGVCLESAAAAAAGAGDVQSRATEGKGRTSERRLLLPRRGGKRPTSTRLALLGCTVGLAAVYMACTFDVMALAKDVYVIGLATAVASLATRFVWRGSGKGLRRPDRAAASVSLSQRQTSWDRSVGGLKQLGSKEEMSVRMTSAPSSAVLARDEGSLIEVAEEGSGKRRQESGSSDASCGGRSPYWHQIVLAIGGVAVVLSLSTVIALAVRAAQWGLSALSCAAYSLIQRAATTLLLPFLANIVASINAAAVGLGSGRFSNLLVEAGTVLAASGGAEGATAAAVTHARAAALLARQACASVWMVVGGEFTLAGAEGLGAAAAWAMLFLSVALSLTSAPACLASATSRRGFATGKCADANSAAHVGGGGDAEVWDPLGLGVGF